MDTLDMSEPTAIQKKGIPVCLNHSSVALAAETGSGKTLSYLLPSVELLKRTEALKGRALPQRPRVVILTPSRELALQVLQDAKALNKVAGPDSHFRCIALVGGRAKQQQIRPLRESGVDMIVGTPGRIAHHREAGDLFLSHLDVLVLDEADTLLVGGFAGELKSILEPISARERRVARSGSKESDPCRVILAGASYAQEIHDAVHKYFDRDFEWVHTKQLHSLPKTARHVESVVVDRGSKHDRLIEEVRERNDRTSVLVFCNSIASCRSTEHALRESGVQSLGLHGGIPPRLRDVNYRRFVSEDVSVLVCTDLAARGLHLPQVGCVINFDAPRDSYEFLHRGGRTARAGRSGEIVSIVHGRERQRLSILRDAAERGDFLCLKATHEAITERRRRVDGRSNVPRRRTAERDAKEEGNAQSRIRGLPKELQRRIMKTRR